MKLSTHKYHAELLAVLLFTGSACAGWAASITQNQETGSINVLGFAPIGQTFTAEFDQLGSIGFRIENSTQIEPGGNTFRYDLLEGAGISGALRASREFTLADGFSGLAYADFSSVSLVPGQQYTVLIAAPDNDWSVSWNGVADINGPIPGRVDYLGGVAITLGSPMADQDLTFQINSVPEPGTAAFMMLVVAGLSLRKGR